MLLANPQQRKLVRRDVVMSAPVLLCIGDGRRRSSMRTNIEFKFELPNRELAHRIGVNLCSETVLAGRLCNGAPHDVVYPLSALAFYGLSRTTLGLVPGREADTFQLCQNCAKTPSVARPGSVL